AIAEDSAGKNVCIVSHGSVIRVLLPKIFGISVEESLKMYPEYGSLSLVEYDGQNYTNPLFNQSAVALQG
ncbi:MAG: histidine phosphatase family protein, partial [Patescibacteria group bacterium]